MELFVDSLARNIWIQSFTIVFATVFGSLVFYRQYLQLRKEQRDVSDSDSRSIRRQVDQQVALKLKDFEAQILSENSQDDIDKRIKEVVQGVSLDEIFQGRENEIWERFNQEQFGACVDQIRDNMESYRDANRQQYARNLAAGLGLSAFAVFVALYLVINRPDIELNQPSIAIIQLLISYVPYITVIIVVEVLAFFFLKLYRQNVEVERYIRNEISSLNAKLAAIFVAVRSEDEAFRQNLISQLFTVERNQVLENGATTIEIEKAKLDVETFKDGLGFFASVNPSNLVSDALKANSGNSKSKE